jgi:hypothetical protein
MKNLKSVASRHGIWLQDSNHFWERVNDKRNNPIISLCEIREILKQTISIPKDKFVEMENDGFSEFVLKSISTDINIPIAFEIDSDGELNFKLLTIMRKKGFTPKDKSAVLLTEAIDIRDMGDFPNAKIKHNKDELEADISIDGVSYHVEIVKAGAYMPLVKYIVEFTDENDSVGVTNAGLSIAYKIFSFVISLLVENYAGQKIGFSAIENSRVKLYKRIITQYESKGLLDIIRISTTPKATHFNLWMK